MYFVMGQGVFVSSQMRRLPFTCWQVIKTTFLWFFISILTTFGSLVRFFKVPHITFLVWYSSGSLNFEIVKQPAKPTTIPHKKMASGWFMFREMKFNISNTRSLFDDYNKYKEKR